VGPRKERGAVMGMEKREKGKGEGDRKERGGKGKKGGKCFCLG